MPISVSFIRIRRPVVMFLLSLSLMVPTHVSASAASSYSWNPRFSCAPAIVTIEQVLGNQSSSLGGATETGSIFDPGISNKRQLNQPCTITNAEGQIVSTFVQINSILMISPPPVQSDCTNHYDLSNGGALYPNASIYCDTTHNLYTSGQSKVCTNTNNTGCMHRIFFEIDRDWMARGYCGVGTVCDNGTMQTQVTSTTLIDIQGFVYWNPDYTNQSWHSFSGWEIHPLTAWKLSSSPPPPPPFNLALTVGFTWSPTTPTPKELVNFTGAVLGGTPPYLVSWNFGDGSATASHNVAATHMYNSSGTFTVTLNATDSAGVKGSASKEMIVIYPLSPLLSWNPKVPCTPIAVTVEQVVGNLPNPLGGATEAGSVFNPGVPNKRALDQPCTITNANGQVISAFVQINNILMSSTSPQEEDCSTSYDAKNGGGPLGGVYCDTTLNVYTPGQSSTCSSTDDTGCMHRIHIEIDRDWKAAGYCGVGTVCDNSTIHTQVTSTTLIDIQGFVYWDPYHTTDDGHSFSGWEIHPVTAWRLSNQPDFSMAASPSSLNILQGGSGTFTVTVNSLNKFSGIVTFNDSSSPPGPSLSWDHTSISLSAGGSANVHLKASTTSSTTPGNYSITAAGTSHFLSHAVRLLVVVPPPDFAISATPTSLTIYQGSSATSQIVVKSLNGFSGTIVFALSSSPTGLTDSLDHLSLSLPPGGSANANLKISTATSTPPDNYTVTVNATSRSFSHTIRMLVNVPPPDFAISATPASLTIYQGSSTQSKIVVKSLNGFSGTIVFALSSSPTGLTDSLDHLSLSLPPGGSANANLQVSATTSTPPGNYTVTVSATAGSISHSIDVAVNMPPSDFSITPTPSSLTIAPGTSGTFQITTKSLDRFSGTIVFNATISPSGPVLAWDHTSISVPAGGSADVHLKVSTTTSTPPGTYTITVTATSGTISHSITLTLYVT
jgi:PKD repeat protein